MSCLSNNLVLVLIIALYPFENSFNTFASNLLLEDKKDFSGDNNKTEVESSDDDDSNQTLSITFKLDGEDDGKSYWLHDLGGGNQHSNNAGNYYQPQWASTAIHQNHQYSDFVGRYQQQQQQWTNYWSQQQQQWPNNNNNNNNLGHLLNQAYLSASGQTVNRDPKQPVEATSITKPVSAQSVVECGIPRNLRFYRHLFDGLVEGMNYSKEENGLKVVGGSPTVVTKWPWQVSLRLNGGHFCGGSIISKRFIVTASHCFNSKMTSKNPSDWTVYAAKGLRRIGESEEVGPLEIESIFVHPKYASIKLDSDIALVKLKQPLVYSDKVQPVCVPKQGSAIPEGSECFITGFGQTEGTGGEGELKEGRIPILSNEACKAKNKRLAKYITENMVCGEYLQGGADACQGDSGGPLVCKAPGQYFYVLHGIVSFGFGCAEENSPGVYARVAQFTNWITAQVRL